MRGSFRRERDYCANRKKVSSENAALERRERELHQVAHVPRLLHKHIEEGEEEGKKDEDGDGEGAGEV